MSETSPFRTDKDRAYRWPPEPGEIEREYVRVTTLKDDGLPKNYEPNYALAQTVDFTIEHRHALDYVLSTPLDPDYFAVDDEWWQRELEWAKLKDAANALENDLRDSSKKPLKTNYYDDLINLSNAEAIAKYLKALPRLHRLNACNRGTAVHKYLERVALGELIDINEVEPQYQQHVINGLKFFSDFKPKFLEVESVVYSDKWGYAGQFDGLIEIDGKVILMDWKTKSKGLTKDIAHQLAAYAFADFIGREDGTKDPMPHIDEFWGVNVTEKKYTVRPYWVEENVFNEFLAMREVSFVMNAPVEKYMGKEIKPPKEAA